MPAAIEAFALAACSIVMTILALVYLSGRFYRKKSLAQLSKESLARSGTVSRRFFSGIRTVMIMLLFSDIFRMVANVYHESEKDYATYQEWILFLIFNILKIVLNAIANGLYVLIALKRLFVFQGFFPGFVKKLKLITVLRIMSTLMTVAVFVKYSVCWYELSTVVKIPPYRLNTFYSIIDGPGSIIFDIFWGWIALMLILTDCTTVYFVLKIKAGNVKTQAKDVHRTVKTVLISLVANICLLIFIYAYNITVRSVSQIGLQELFIRLYFVISLLYHSGVKQLTAVRVHYLKTSLNDTANYVP
ncbi:hypothetical protein BKA69DRAFT_1127384 [Paraphysoderma sedebokerense]|nr:hypothetical protein BKA69DRAFT_1127384 [Paraphysoderma sedebokerense]